VLELLGCSIYSKKYGTQK